MGTKAKAATAISAAALALAAYIVPRFEGLALDPYADVGGVLTVCYGETHGVEQRHYTPAECKAMLQTSLASHGADLAACMPTGLPDHVQAAVLIFGYNVGAKAFCDSTMARKLQSGDIAGACTELSRWTRVAGRDCRDPAAKCGGIVKRREVERAMCEGAAR